MELSGLINEDVSHQALDKKLSFRHLQFVKMLVKQAMLKSYPFDSFKELDSLKKFNRVLIEDSTCVKLSKNLYGYFSGVSNGLSKVTNARIQVSMDLKKCCFENVALTTYSQNDSCFSDNILNRIQSQDLIIRDLGYWKRSVLEDISKANCYFISKLRSNTKLLETHEDQDFSLVNKLKELDKKECKKFDLECRLGAQIKLPVRIVGKKMDEDQIKMRRKKMIKSRHKNCKVSKNSAYLLSWNIYITNVSKQDLSEKDIADLYRLRWHIEMVFKNWKSNFKITELLSGSVGKCPIKVEMKMYLSLLYVMMIYQPTFNYFSKRIYKKSKKILSALKYGQYINDNLKSFIFNKSKKILSELMRYCCYENRKDRRNYYQHRYLL